MIINAKTYNTNPVTVRYSVKDYLDELHNRYGEYRKEREKLDTRLEKENERWQNEICRGWQDMKIRLQDEHNHNELLKSIGRIHTYEEFIKTCEKLLFSICFSIPKLSI